MQFHSLEFELNFFQEFFFADFEASFPHFPIQKNIKILTNSFLHNKMFFYSYVSIK